MVLDEAVYELGSVDVRGWPRDCILKETLLVSISNVHFWRFQATRHISPKLSGLADTTTGNWKRAFFSFWVNCPCE